jgi:hypothetical protein
MRVGHQNYVDHGIMKNVTSKQKVGSFIHVTENNVTIFIVSPYATWCPGKRRRIFPRFRQRKQNREEINVS